MDKRMMMAMLGSGMASQAGQDLQNVPSYQQYAIEMQSSGMQPLPQNDPRWVEHYQQMIQPQGLLSQ